MDWTVDYGNGPAPCHVPHVWHLDVDVRWEGPAVYRTNVHCDQTSWLVFHGVSYHAEVFVNDDLAKVHDGIWDAFEVELQPGKSSIRVEVVKNGGSRYPVKSVLSGFLPYVYHSFGGLFREVELVDEKPHFDRGPITQRVSVEQTSLFIDGKPWFMRGVLSWGWYPETCSPQPGIDQIRSEVRRAKALGFNLIKFCLWLPPQTYFQVLEEEEMWAWVELPLWLPSEGMDLEAAFNECERIVRQYRHHDRIVAWTCGCELSHGTPHEFRQRLYQMVKDLTGCPLVKDNSGGAEMYGGDLREYGDFYDFHPYCDTMFYPSVLDSLQNGPRKSMPILLGEYNDYDVYRPLYQLAEESPYWTSSDPELNDQGVRWQHDLPRVLAEPTTWLPRDVEDALAAKSRSKCGWIREFVTMTVLQHRDISGYVVTGLDDTPISTSGCYDDRCLDDLFNDFTIFRIPHRQPPWVNGGNRPAWSDCHNVFPGTNTIRLGARSTQQVSQSLSARWWKNSGSADEIEVVLEPNQPREIAQLVATFSPGTVDALSVGGQYFEFACYDRFDWVDCPDWAIDDSRHLMGQTRNGSGPTFSIDPQQLPDKGVVVLTANGVLSMPFWRECVQWNSSGIEALNSWDFLYPVSTDQALDPEWLDVNLPGAEWLLTRVDTRTYKRHPYLVKKGQVVVTTLRPWGGLGAQPVGLANNPAGCELMRLLMSLATQASQSS